MDQCWPRAILLDLDGTLVDSFFAITLALDRALVASGRVPLGLEWTRAHVGRGLRRLIAAAVGAGDDRAVDELMRVFGEHYDRVLETDTRAYPGVPEAVSRLARCTRLAVVSNKPVRWSRRLVAHLAWDEWIPVVVGPEDAGAPKPDPAMVRVALARLGLGAEDALLVGDMVVDVETGQAAGIPVVGVAVDTGDAADLIDAGALAVVPGVHALPDWIAGHCPGGATFPPHCSHGRPRE